MRKIRQTFLQHRINYLHDPQLITINFSFIENILHRYQLGMIHLTSRGGGVACFFFSSKFYFRFASGNFEV